MSTDTAGKTITIRIPRAETINFLSIPAAIIFTAIIISASLISAGNNVRDALKTSSSTNKTAQVTTTPTDPTSATVALGSMTVRGSTNAKVAIVEFSDFECPFCGQFHNDAGKSIQSDYVDTGKAQFYFRHLPLSMHPHARSIAEAAVCANEQGKFWSFHDSAFNDIIANNRSVPDGLISKVSKEAGIDENKLNDCINSKKDSGIIDTDSNDAQAAGISGTPGFVIGIVKDGKIENGTIISGAQPYAQFKQVLDSYIQS